MSKKKHYLIGANALFLIHCIVGAAILIGWLFSAFKIPYLLLLVTWIGSWIFLGYCPITKLEFSLRNKAGGSIDTNAEAITYYMRKFFNKKISSRIVFITGIVLFCIFFALGLFW